MQERISNINLFRTKIQIMISAQYARYAFLDIRVDYDRL